MARELHNFKVGDTVTVLEVGYNRRVHVEGIATITRLLDGEDRYSVEFTHPARKRFERYVDPDAQTDPQAYCDTFNQKLASKQEQS